MRLLKFLLIADNHIFFIGSSFLLSDFKKTKKNLFFVLKFQIATFNLVSFTF